MPKTLFARICSGAGFAVERWWWLVWLLASGGGPKCAMHVVCMCVIEEAMEKLGACLICCVSSHTVAVVSFWHFLGLDSLPQSMRKTDHVIISYTEFSQMSIGRV